MQWQLIATNQDGLLKIHDEHTSLASGRNIIRLNTIFIFM